jgi:AcrR family transcriptional regulator
MARATPDDLDGDSAADWHRRVVARSLRTATARSVDRGHTLIRAAMAVLDRTNGGDITVQDVADEAGQSLRTLYQYFESKDDLLLAVFEEAMRRYAALVRQAIVDLTDPLDRLAGALVAAVRMPAASGTGVDRGLARLRPRLSEVDPDLVGRARSALTGLVRELVVEAAAAGRITVADPETATYLLLSLNAAYITGETLGNDTGVRRPDVEGVTAFCLRGLGAELDDDWFAAVDGRLHLPTPRRGGGRRAAAPRTAPSARQANGRTTVRVSR